MVIINNSISCTLNLLKVDCKYPHCNHQEKTTWNKEYVNHPDYNNNLQCRHILNYHILHLNLYNFCQSDLSHTGKKFQKKKITLKPSQRLKSTNMLNFNNILVLIIIFSVSGYIQVPSDNIINMKIIHALINLNFNLI